MTILGISGSLRSESFNTWLLNSATGLLPETASIQVASLADIPLFNADVEATQVPESVRLLQERISKADGVLIATPEYNHSYTGVLKNALDWMSRPPLRPFTEKPVAVIGAATGNFGSVRAQLDLRKVLHSMGAYVLPKPELLVSQAKTKFGADGILNDEATRTVYVSLLEKFITFAARFSS